jgi:hypothetical protein
MTIMYNTKDNGKKATLERNNKGEKKNGTKTRKNKAK